MAAGAGPVLGDTVHRAARVAPWLWGAAVAAYVSRFYFAYAPGEMHLNHQEYSYVHRLVEFRSALGAGYLFPQWATHFRHGLGNPYFGYYPSGFFYVAAAVASVVSIPTALALTVFGFSLLGYGGTFALVRRHFGAAAGTLAGTAVLLSTYPHTELYRRGDLAEYSAMMLLPALLHALVVWLEEGRAWARRVLALEAAMLPTLHNMVGLMGYPMLAGAAIVYALSGAGARAVGAARAVLIGVGLSAFYWLPVVLEWNLVQGDRAATGPYRPVLRISPLHLLGVVDPPTVVPLTLGSVVPALVAVASATLVIRRRRVTRAQWRLVGVLWLWVVLSVFLMHPASQAVWDTLPLLHRVQFPWRFLVVVTVATGALAGCVAAATRPLLALGAAALLVVTLRLPPPLLFRYPYPHRAADMVSFYVAPDFQHEWLPAGAWAIRDPHVATLCTPGCTAALVERAQGRLQLAVDAAGTASVTVPHYYFPVGWHATLDGVPIALGATPEGLMRVAVPHGGTLVITFHTTPAKRLGVLVSAVVLAGWGLAGILARGGNSARDPPTELPLDGRTVNAR
jgi:hypothetical protein